MRHAIWMAGLSLTLSNLSAGADEPSPIPRLEGEANTLPAWPPMIDLQADARRRLLEPARSVRARAARPQVARLEADGTLTLQAQDIGAADLIEEIAALGKLQVLVAGDVTGLIHLIRMRGKAPEQALEDVARVAKLDIQKRGAVFLVRKLQANASEPALRPEEPLFSLTFKEISMRHVAELLSKQSGVPIGVEGALQDKAIRLMRLQDVTLKAALESMALVLDARLSWQNERYMLSAAPKQPSEAR